MEESIECTKDIDIPKSKFVFLSLKAQGFEGEGSMYSFGHSSGCFSDVYLLTGAVLDLMKL